MILLKHLEVALCILILAGQLWRAKKTDSENTHWLYHTSAALMSLGVACKMFLPVNWTDLAILSAVFIFQCAGSRDNFSEMIGKCLTNIKSVYRRFKKSS